MSLGHRERWGIVNLRQLGLWEECTGRLADLEETDDGLVVHLITLSLKVNWDSPAASHLEEELNDATGQRVSLLRTDWADRPLLVKIQEER